MGIVVIAQDGRAMKQSNEANRLNTEMQKLLQANFVSMNQEVEANQNKKFRS